jgi:lambda family phage portal protein
MDNWLDRLIQPLSPQWALKRMHARAVLATYEAAQPSRLRKHRRDQSGPNRLAEKSAVALRIQMRYLERNHDITKGSLDVLVNNTVGPNGIGIEFQPRKMDGTIHDVYAKQLAEAYEDWQRKPEVTHRRDWQNVQRTTARTKFRDGEAFAQQIVGAVQFLDHGTRVPYSLELMEADHVPYEYSDTGRGVFNGVERDEWGRVRGWYVYKKHPGEMANLPTLGDLKRIPADRMLQVAELHRFGQLRGITPYASVINRIEDIKDYEESERIAAKIAAMMTAYVKRQAPTDEGYTPQVDEDGNTLKREIGFQPGMVIDTLAVGEEIGLIDTSRPNVNLVHFRNGQLRAFAAGIAASYSSVARNYEGTYSAQRQELVETFVHYAVHTDDFIGQFNRPVIEAFINAAHLSGVAKKPGDLKPGSEYDVLYLAPSMPWIDPAKEALAWLTLVKAGFASEVEVIRKRGQSPESVLEQVDLWRKKCADKGLTFDSNAGLELLLKEAATDKEAPAEARAQAQAMLDAVRSGVIAMSQREPMAVNVAAPVVNVTAPPAPDVKLEHHTHIDNQVDVPPAQVEVQPAGDVHNHIQPSEVIVQPAPQGEYLQLITRDADGEISQILNKPVPPTGAAP